MPYQPFHEHFPDLAELETRVVELSDFHSFIHRPCKTALHPVSKQDRTRLAVHGLIQNRNH